MYTIKQASIRTGVTVPLLRAWERRYGIPSPSRTSSGYRLYDEPALARVRQMRALVASGWSPSQAARAVLEGRASGEGADSGAADAAASGDGAGGAERAGLLPEETATVPFELLVPDAVASGAGPLPVDRFVAAAAALDEAALDESLAEAFATLGADEAIARFALPALVAIGEAWAEGRVDVSAEHAASNAVMRRLGALYEAVGQAASDVDVVVGLPPRGRHEVGALAFAVACRRAGLRVLYLGADVPLESWRAVIATQPLAAVVLAAVTRDEARSATEVAHALRASNPDLTVAIGGGSAEATVGVAGPASGDGILVLPQGLKAAVATLRARLAG